MAEFDLPEGLKGLRPTRYQVVGAGVSAIKTALYNSEERAEDKAHKTSYLGTPVFSNFIVEPGSYIDLNGDKIDFEGLDIDAVLLTVSQSKNIVKTAIQGRKGTVKEYVSSGDFSVSITGVLSNQATPNGNTYPIDEVSAFVGIMEVPDAIKINSEFLDLFDIDSLVVENYSLPQEEGVRNQQRFTVSLLSEDPVELDDLQIIKNNPRFI